jgi:hypothetical protein
MKMTSKKLATVYEFGTGAKYYEILCVEGVVTKVTRHTEVIENTDTMEYGWLEEQLEIDQPYLESSLERNFQQIIRDCESYTDFVAWENARPKMIGA